MNFLCQVDLIDTQLDGYYRFILMYLTKYVLFKPLTQKRTKQIACILLDICTAFGAPCISQGDNGREFVNTAVWGVLEIVHGTPRHS